MGFPTFGVHQNSYEASKKFNHGWAYFGRGGSLFIAIDNRGRADLVSAMTPFQGELKRALSIRDVSASSVHAPSALGDDTVTLTITHKIAKAATGIGGLRSPDDH
jgi:hypothetical protein